MSTESTTADTKIQPPPTRKEPVNEELHGRTVIDEYRWLEGDNSDPARMGSVTPEVSAWTDAQNAYTRRLLDGLPGRRELEERLRPLLQIGAVSAPIARGGRYFYLRREGDQNQPLVYVRDGAHGEESLLIDPSELDATGLTTVTWISPSHDGKLLAYGTYRAGDENTTLNLLEVDTRAKLPLEIPNKVWQPSWLPDDSGFLYRNLKDPHNPYSGQVMFHELGGDPAGDPVLFRQLTPEEDERLATTWGPNGSVSHDGRWLLLYYSTGANSNDVWLADFEAYRRNGELEKVDVSVGTAGNAYGVVAGDTLYLYTYKGAPNGRVVAAPVSEPGEDSWRDVIPERDDATIEAVALAEGRIVVNYLRDASSHLEVFTLDGTPLGELRLPGIGSASITTYQGSTEAFVTFSSFNYPATIFRVDLADPAAEPELWAQPEVPVTPEDVAVEQVWYRSKDGTRVSMFLAHRKDLVKDGEAPTLLTGYGGFGISQTPSFSATMFQWFEVGGVLALPNLRGGGEYGDAWHEAGMRERKQNVFDDFIAAAEWLIDNGYTNPSRLAIAGGSNGGLLTGAALTQRPELFAAVIVAVPLLDMLRFQNFLMARYWVPEYGSAEEAEDFAFLAEYSPYQRVVPGTAYPAVFLTAGEHDTRVHALHARKMTAALQSATASDPAEKPVLLWVDREAGHGQGKPLNLRLREVVDQRIFLLWQLGLLDDDEKDAR